MIKMFFYYWSDFFLRSRFVIFLLWIISPLVVIYIFCSGSNQTGGDLIFFALDHMIHIKLVVIHFFVLDHDHFDFGDMTFLIQIQWSMIFCADPWLKVYSKANFDTRRLFLIKADKRNRWVWNDSIEQVVT